MPVPLLSVASRGVALDRPDGAAECVDAQIGASDTSRPIYLDNLATTPLAPEAREAMLPWLDEGYGNPSSSTHALGWAAADAVEEARELVAALMGVNSSSCVTFTSGATESNNTVIKGAFDAFSRSSMHIVTTAIEHPSVLEPCRFISERGASVSVLQPDSDGIVDPEKVQRSMRPNTRLITVMAANNEVGTLQPLSAIGEIARSHGALFHVDAAQAVAKVELDIDRLGIDFLSVSAHKLYGPKGVGALYARPGAIREGLPPLLHGGGQELDRRAGTPPVAQISGFGAAARVAAASWRRDAQRVRGLRDLLWEELASNLSRLHLNGSTVHRLPGCLNVSVDKVPADVLISTLPGLALSSGSACSSHHAGGSHVLRALGLPRDRERGAVRIGLGRFTTEDEVRVAARMILDAVGRIRAARG
jgi:cysteine desulfurase